MYGKMPCMSTFSLRLTAGSTACFRQLSTLPPANAHLVCGFVPAKISSLYLARNRGVDAGKIVQVGLASGSGAIQDRRRGDGQSDRGGRLIEGAAAGTLAGRHSDKW